MTVSVDDAQLPRSAHQSCTRHGAFKDRPIYRVSGMFHGQPASGPAADAAVTFPKAFCRDRLRRNVLGRRPIRPSAKEKSMLYAILAYHVEAEVMSWTPAEDAALMTDLLRVHDRLEQQKLLGPAARLGATGNARTLRGPGAGTVLDGPFAETKEQLLGFYVVDCAGEDAAIGVARELRRVNPSAVYEIRPIALYVPGAAIPTTKAADEGGRG
jgi:hypothetical protein